MTTGGKEGRQAFEQELKSSNTAYVENIKAKVEQHGIQFSDDN